MVLMRSNMDLEWPRIDPIRLLSCLKPLLNLQTGGIKSDKEVDKVFVLMTKFSKKLVSKCTYINILKATPSDVLNLFMERGGWEMLYNWVVEAKGNKNHVLLNEILGLFLVTPATVERLRTNSLPKEVKQISVRWDVEETKSFAEKVVAFWINIARNEDSSARQAQAHGGALASSATQDRNTNPVSANQTTVAQGSSYDMQSLGQLTDERAINSNLTDSIIYESENPPNLDLDVGNFDLEEIMDYNFNPDVFRETIDMHLSDLNANESDRAMQIPNNHVSNDINAVQQHVSHIPAAPSVQPVPDDLNAVPVAVAASRTVPRIVIKTSGGQRSVVTAAGDGTQITQAQPITNSKERLCYVTHNGQRFLMSLRVADNDEISTIKAVDEATSSETAATQDQQVTSSVSSSAESTPVPETKRKRPRKDPTITAAKNNAALKVANVDAVDQPKVLKTYSKKTNAEMISSKATTEKGAETQEPPKAKASSVSTTSGSASSKISSPASSSSKKPTSRSRGSSSKSAAAAAAQAKAEKDLRDKVKEQRKKMKERVEAAKNQDKKKDDDKQKQKDDQTLKEIYGGTAAAVNSVKIPKKPKPSFTDLIGVPGASEDTKKEKITKEKNQDGDKGGKTKLDDQDQDSSSSPPHNKDDELKDATGLGSFSRPESKEIGPAKERRHVKVYTSSKSKNMDLLETMTKGSAAKGKKLDVETAKPEGKSIEKGNAMSFEDAISGGGSSGAAIKPAKRPSIDSGKTGDSKKLKLDESVKDKKDKSKDKDAKKSKDKSPPVEKSKKPQVIQESSLFMDALNSSSSSSKIKKRRRISSSNDKEKEVIVPNVNLADDSTTIKAPQSEDEQEKAVKPVFNFYRDTLNDDDDLPGNEDLASTTGVSDASDNDIVILETPADSAMVEDDEIRDDFAPVEGEGKLRSCLCLHRPKGKPKKILRWREEDELKEFHYFEMDETERVNVTKQQGNQANKNFSEMRLMEKSEEKLFIRRKFAGDVPPVEKFEWVKLRKIDPDQLSGQPEVSVSSHEKQVQEERERSILEVFYFPGTMLPDNPSEEYVLNLELDRTNTPRVIPADDIPVLTKVSDYRNTPWPAPRFAKPEITENRRPVPKIPRGDPVKSVAPNPLPNIDPTNAFANPYNVANNPSNFDQFNPWIQSFDPHPQNNDPWKAAEVQPFGAFPAVQPNAVPAAVNSFQAMSFGYPFPPPQIGAAPVPMNQIPGQLQPPVNFPGFGPPIPNQFDHSQHQMTRDDGPPHNSRHPPGRPNRDVDYRDVGRRNEREREHDRDTRNRDSRPVGGRDRDRERDRENRDRGRDRERFEKDRDYRNNHDRRRPGGRRSTLCNYFAKGFCREGNKCAFLHPGVNGPPSNDVPNNAGSNNFPRHKPSPPPVNNRYDDRRRSSPPSSQYRDLPNENHNSSSSFMTASSSGPSGSSGAPKEIPEIESPTPETETRFIMPPSSPNEHQSFPLSGEPVKVIPTFTEEDWG